MHFVECVECKESFVCHFWSNDALLVVCLERKKVLLLLRSRCTTLRPRLSCAFYGLMDVKSSDVTPSDVISY